MMRLVHFAARPVTEVYAVDPASRSRTDKPAGLWVSDEDAEMSWSEWCRSEGYGLERLAVAHEVTLADDARILYLRSPADIYEFTERYGLRREDLWRAWGIDWAAIAARYQGIVITPYIWECRHTVGWYYGWDCASGCVWDPAAIASIRVLEPAPVSTVDDETYAEHLRLGRPQADDGGE